MRRSFSLALLTLALAVPALAGAQDVPNLSGTWVLQADKSDFGMMPAPTSRTDVITHKEPSLVIKRSISMAQGDVTTELTFGVDGKPWKNTSMGNEMSSTLKWDGKVLVVVSSVSTPQGDATITDRFTLSDDGKTLTQARVIAIQGQEIAQRMVLVKQ